MPNRKGFTPIIILVVVLILAAIAGAFYLGTKKGTVVYSPTSTPISYPNPSPTISISPTLNPTANLKTYTSPNNFNFQYPTPWILTTKTVKKGEVANDPGHYTVSAQYGNVDIIRLSKNSDWEIEINFQKDQPTGGVNGVNTTDYRAIKAFESPAYRLNLENGKYWSGGDEPDPHPQPIFFGANSTYQYTFSYKNVTITYYSKNFTAQNIQNKNLDYASIREMDDIVSTLKFTQ